MIQQSAMQPRGIKVRPNDAQYSLKPDIGKKTWLSVVSRRFTLKTRLFLFMLFRLVLDWLKLVCFDLFLCFQLCLCLTVEFLSVYLYIICTFCRFYFFEAFVDTLKLSSIGVFWWTLFFTKNLLKCADTLLISLVTSDFPNSNNI